MKRKILILMMFAFLPFRLFHLTYPLLDAHNFRQTQTATYALNLYKGRLNPFKTELDIFGTGKEKYLILEFPFYETIVAALYKIFSFHEWIGRMVTISFGFWGSYYLYKLIKILLKNNRIAFLSSIIYLSMPINMFYQRTFMVDTTAIALLLSGLYFFVKWTDTDDEKDFIYYLVFMTFGFVQKAVYGPFWLLPISVFYLSRKKTKRLFNKKFIFSMLFPSIILFLWQTYANIVNAQNGHGFFSSANMDQLTWNFGSLNDRLSLTLWIYRVNQILNGIFLKPGIILFLIGLITLRKFTGRKFIYSWFLSQILYLFVFFRINSHNYYQLVMTPVISVFIAIGFYKVTNYITNFFSNFVTNKYYFKYFRGGFYSLILGFFIYKSWINAIPSFYIDWNWYNDLLSVDKILPSKSVGILVTPGYDWNSAYTYYPKRKMLLESIENVNTENVKKWKNSGFFFLMLYDYNSYPKYLNGLKPRQSLDFLDNYHTLLSRSSLKVLKI